MQEIIKANDCDPFICGIPQQIKEDYYQTTVLMIEDAIRERREIAECGEIARMIDCLCWLIETKGLYRKDKYSTLEIRRAKQIEDDLSNYFIGGIGLLDLYKLIKFSMRFYIVRIKGVLFVYDNEKKEIGEKLDQAKLSNDFIIIRQPQQSNQMVDTGKKKPGRPRKQTTQTICLDKFWSDVKWIFKAEFDGFNFVPWSHYEAKQSGFDATRSCNKELNCFVPYPFISANYSDIDEDKINLYLDLLHCLVDVNLCNIDRANDGGHIQELYCLRFWQWLAVTILKPRDHVVIIPAFIGGQGIGKNTIVNIIKAVIGSDNIAMLDSGSFGSNFNSMIANKTVCFVDEFQFYNNSYNKLKTITGSNTILINEKGKPQYTIDHHLHIILTTNERNIFKRVMERNQRRILIINSEHNQQTIDNTKITQIYDLLNGDGKEDFICVFYHHLIDILKNPIMLKDWLSHLDDCKFMQPIIRLDDEITRWQNIEVARTDCDVACMIDIVQECKETYYYDIWYKVTTTDQGKILVADKSYICDTVRFDNVNHLGGLFNKRIDEYTDKFIKGDYIKGQFFKPSFLTKLGFDVEKYDANGSLKRFYVPKRDVLLNRLVNGK